MKSIAKKILRRMGIEIRKAASIPPRQFVELPPLQSPPKGHVLIAYVVDPFLLRKGEKIPSSHTLHIESKLLAQVFLDLGYAVDVVDFRSTTFVPRKNYDILVSSRTCLQRYAELLGPDCLKIFHVTVSHWLYNNSAALTRCLDVQRRRHVSLKSYKLIEENQAIEFADFAVYSTGNDFVPGTYAYAGKPSARFPLCTYTVYPSPENKDIESARHNFLWLGSLGFVHKGLDLVLEAFASMPEFHLYVCGPIEKEPAFQKAFDRELYHTPNIETIGWVDISGETFQDIARKCAALIYPSCAEGAGGNVLTCMQAGLVPVITYESCVDVTTGNGIQIEDLTVEAVQTAVRQLSSMAAEDLHAMTMRAWNFARTHHTHDAYKREYRKAVKAAIKNKKATPHQNS